MRIPGPNLYIGSQVDAHRRAAADLPNHAHTPVAIDLPSQTVALADGSWQRDFEIDPFKKYRLMRGLDDISMTLEYEPDIVGHETARPGWLPKTG